MSCVPSSSPIGRRIQVIGNTCSGKSTLGKRLAGVLDLPLVELDAINWQPEWVSLAEMDPEELERRVGEATRGDSWVVAGSYSAFSQRIFWPRLQTVVCLDLPLLLLVWRVIVRSWRRWRTKELLWGTNYEQFWPQLMVWSKNNSLIWWAVTQQSRKRRKTSGLMADPQWAHIRFIHLTSSKDVESFTRSVIDGKVYHRGRE